MINVEKAFETLRGRYPELESVADRVYRGVDVHEGRTYAVRYFDLHDNVPGSLETLRNYQDEVLGSTYYSADAKADLRWNHYLYFVTSLARFDSGEFLSAKAFIEADREYARKIVVEETALGSLIAGAVFGSSGGDTLPPDALTLLRDALDQHRLAFVVDENLVVPAVVRHIADGTQQGLQRLPSAAALRNEEAVAHAEVLTRLEIQGFRSHPKQRTFDLGVVNLVSGVNGVGKTSLLEAVEYLFCGKTRRTDKSVLPKTMVTGTWAGGGPPLRTSPSTLPAQLRARHLAWYGKAELRRLTLDDSFGKFNFLDTDAAVHLTVERSRERLSDDLFQLLLGAEASKALDRLERVEKHLEEQRRSIEKDVGTLDLRRTDAARRAEELKAAPRESDELLRSVASGLKALGWKGALAGKADAEKLADVLVGAMTNARIVRATRTALVSVEAQRGPADALRGVLGQLSDIEKEQKREGQETRNAEAELEAVAARIAASEALEPLVRGGVWALSRELGTLRSRYAEVSRALAAVETSMGNLPEGAATNGGSVGAAVRRLESLMKEAVAQQQRAREALASLESMQAAITTARQQLRSAALNVIEQTHDGKHCPVCLTEFPEPDLTSAINALASGSLAGSEESDRIRRDIETADATVRSLSKNLEAFRALQRFSRADDQMTVAACVTKVQEEQACLSALRTAMDAAEASMLTHEELGWTGRRVDELAAAAGVPSAASESELQDALLRAVGERDALVARLSQLEGRSRARNGRLAEVAAANGLAPDVTLAAATNEMTERVRAADQGAKAAEAVIDLLALDSSPAIETVEAQLAQLHELVVKLRTAVQREAEYDAALRRQNELVSEAADEIAGHRVRLKRLNGAQRVISDLIAGQSGQQLANQVLRENAVSIATTFEKIHAPNEFDVVAGEGLRIIRRSSTSEVELEEMSSGQRAAYALSLFFAMNERLKNGPKVLIFDDPVSHVDDINTLSFLDHLRDISLTGMRQIFFATADTKLAGLFLRKFGFLGEDFKHIQLEREA